MSELLVIARHRIAEGAEAEVLALLPAVLEAARAEPGCLEFDAYRKLGDERSYVLLERYTSREAFADHRETPEYQDVLVAQIVPRLESRTIETYDIPDSAGRKSVEAGGADG